MKKAGLRFLVVTGVVAFGLVWAAADDPTALEMERGARQFLNALDADQRAVATIDFADEERYNFHYIPRERKGVSHKVLSPSGRALASSLLATGLSGSGMRRALDIMYLEQILFEIEKRPIRDPEAYHVTIFGEPSSQGRWGWRVEGHHLSLNFTLRDGRVVSAAPAFMGVNPANVLEGPQKGMRVLEEEELLGRALLHSFTNREPVIIEAEAPRDIVTTTSRRVDIGNPAGVGASDMTPEQRELLEELIAIYAHRLRPELAQAELMRIREAGLERVRFAWAGSGEPGEPHYYRIHGPTFLVEYDNTQNDANHIHTVWRDPERDWGESDPISDHYARSPHHQHGHATAGDDHPH